MPTRRRGLTSVARSVMRRSSQRRFGRTSQATLAASRESSREALSPIVNRRLVRYSQPRAAGRGRYEMRSRQDTNIAVGRYVGMAH